MLEQGSAKSAAASKAAAKAAAKAKADKGKPTKGECWQATLKYADAYANWGSRRPVSCDQPHQLYTYAVVTLDQAHKGSEFTKAGYVRSAVWDDALDTCSSKDNVDLDDFDETGGRLYPESYLPDEDRWKAGARWVRCDIAVLAVGSSVAHPSLGNLPSYASLLKAAQETTSPYGFCVNVPGGIGSGGPKGKNAVYADCTDNPQWRLQGNETIVAPTNDDYPTAAELNAAYLVSCKNLYADATHITYPYYPSKNAWDDGTNTLECWVGRK